MRATSHLHAGLVSILILIMGLIGFDLYARSLEGRYVNALAPLDLTQTINGIALQRAASVPIRSFAILRQFGNHND